MNTCYMALDYHIEKGRCEQTALIYDFSPVANTKKTYSDLELRDGVAFNTKGLMYWQKRIALNNQ